MELGGRGGAGWKKSNLCEYVKIMTKKKWCYDDVVPQQISKRMCPEICGSEVADQKLPCTLAVRGLEEPR